MRQAWRSDSLQRVALLFIQHKLSHQRRCLHVVAVLDPGKCQPRLVQRGDCAGYRIALAGRRRDTEHEHAWSIAAIPASHRHRCKGLLSYSQFCAGLLRCGRTGAFIRIERKARRRIGDERELQGQRTAVALRAYQGEPGRMFAALRGDRAVQDKLRRFARPEYAG